MSKDIECPYCGHWQNINHDDGYGYEEDKTHQQECESCEKTFTFTTSIIYHYEADVADCLNGSEHDYERTNTHPSCFSKMMCSMCSDEREMTEEERISFNIPTKQEYFQSLE